MTHEEFVNLKIGDTCKIIADHPVSLYSSDAMGDIGTVVYKEGDPAIRCYFNKFNCRWGLTYSQLEVCPGKEQVENVGLTKTDYLLLEKGDIIWSLFELSPSDGGEAMPILKGEMATVVSINRDTYISLSIQGKGNFTLEYYLFTNKDPNGDL
jgi:hypothetical protein